MPEDGICDKMTQRVKWGGIVTVRKIKPGLSSAALRYLALFLMLLDHTWVALVQPNQFWMTCVGRLAFPIFAFLIAEGFYHTSNRKRYALRLFVGGVISEIPFNVFAVANFVNPNHQNVMFTLLFGLLALWAFRWAQENGGVWRYLAACAAFAALYVLADRLRVDYRGRGVTMVVMFGLLRGVKWEKLWQVLCLGILCYCMPSRILHIGVFAFPIQNLGVLALLPIWLYNGEPGRKSKPLQYGAYLFYPAHLGVLAVLRRLLLLL